LKKNISLILGVALLILVLFLTFNILKNNNLKDELTSLKEEIKTLENENKGLRNLDKTSNDNTFEEDVKWFVSEVYGLEDRAELYDNISLSVTDDVIKDLFGNDVPPKKSETSEHSLERKLDNIEVYGKFKDDKNYIALATFDLTFEYRNEKDTSFTIVQVNLTKKEDKWLISNFEEYSNR